jgi:serine/threonine protein phosphatase PrpC
MRVGSASMQGYREEMEDAHATVLGMQGSNATTAFFGVFDGHGARARLLAVELSEKCLLVFKSKRMKISNVLYCQWPSLNLCNAARYRHHIATIFAPRAGGEKAALYAAERLPAIVGEYENSALFSEASEETDGSSQSGSAAGGPFAEAMLRFDAEFLATPHHAHGATAIWSLVQPIAAAAAAAASASATDSASASSSSSQQQQFRVIVANVGDSRCLWIGGDGQCLFATTDHKPKDPIEHEVGDNDDILLRPDRTLMQVYSHLLI